MIEPSVAGKIVGRLRSVVIVRKNMRVKRLNDKGEQKVDW